MNPRPGAVRIMSDPDGFLAETLARQMEAERALVSGDAGPRLDMTSHRLREDPVTVFGAKVPIRSGWDEVSETLRWLAARSSEFTDYRCGSCRGGERGCGGPGVHHRL